MNERKTYKIVFWFLAVILLILPYWSAVIAFLSSWTGLTPQQLFMVRAFYEPILIILFLAVVFNPKWEKRQLNLKLLDNLIIGYLIWAILSIPINHLTLSQGIQGLRYNGLFFGFFLLARFSFFPESRVKLLTGLTILGGKIVSVLAVLEAFVLGANWWQRLGVLPSDSTYGFGVVHRVVNVPQAMATLEGPNQLGSFLLLPFFLLLTQKIDDKRKNYYRYLWLTLIVLAIVLTFSRSALIGLTIGILIYLFSNKETSNTSRLTILGGITVLIVASIWYFNWHGGVNRDFWSHGLSNDKHWYSMYVSLDNELSAKDIIFGRGIGTSGPASFKFAPSVPESWYLQVFEELGLVGLMLWLVVIVVAIKRYFRKNLGLILALISISIAAVFLHTWADNPAVSISFWILLGVMLPNRPAQTP